MVHCILPPPPFSSIMRFWVHYYLRVGRLLAEHYIYQYYCQSNFVGYTAHLSYSYVYLDILQANDVHNRYLTYAFSVDYTESCTEIHSIARGLLILYSQKIWQGIEFGGLLEQSPN